MYNNINKNSKKNSNKAWSPKPEKPMRQKSGKEKFFDKMEKTNKGFYVRAVVPKSLPDNMTYTTNGAVAYSTTSSALLDMFTKLVSYRSLDEKQVVTDWRKAFNENPYLAMRFLGYTMDIRCGAGERRFTQIVIRDLVKNGGASIAAKLVPLIGEYSRYDMLYQFRGNPITDKAVRNLITTQIESDLKNMKQNKSISLIAKWLKSCNSHNAETRNLGLWTAKQLNMTERNYRKTISSLRKYLDVVERKMSSDNWQAIDYENGVCSRANLNYNKAFLRHDTERRQAFLNALKTGEAKINASVANPCDIVNKYMNLNARWYGLPQRADDTLEGMWKALPDMIPDDKGMLVVCDCSGSMQSGIGSNTNMRCIDVAMSLAIYCADHLKGAFANKYITFSADPHIVRFNDNDSLCNKLRKTLECQDCSNTNLEKVFDLILTTAVNNHSPQSDLPERILIVSDGEFDSMCDANNTVNRYGWSSSRTPVDKTFMQSIVKRFKNAGYKMPTIVFWRVNTRNSTALPFKVDDRGIMVSGYSTNLLKMVLSDKTNPMDALLEQLNIPRYDCFETAYSA